MDNVVFFFGIAIICFVGAFILDLLIKLLDNEQNKIESKNIKKRDELLDYIKANDDVTISVKIRFFILLSLSSQPFHHCIFQ